MSKCQSGKGKWQYGEPTMCAVTWSLQSGIRNIEIGNIEIESGNMENRPCVRYPGPSKVVNFQSGNEIGNIGIRNIGIRNIGIRNIGIRNIEIRII